MFKTCCKYLGLTILLLAITYIIIIVIFPIHFQATVDDDSNLPSITLNDYKFHAETFGDRGNPILLGIHGGPGGDYRYMLSMKELSKDFFVILYDQRMTGLSSRSSKKAITIQSFFDDLNTLIEHYDNGSPIYLVGHSWGAMMASGYVGMYPDKISKIILIEPGILRHDIADPFLNQKRPELSIVDYLTISKIWLNKWRVRNKIDKHARDDYFLSMVYLYFGNKDRHNLPKFTGWRMGAFSMDQTLGKLKREPEFIKNLDFLKGVEKFNGQVLFLTSENNKVYGVDYQKQHLKYYKNSEQLIVPNSGHTIFIDQPEISNKMISEFLTTRPNNP